MSAIEEEDEWEDIDEEEDDVCTFALSGRGMLHQQIYICQTCSESSLNTDANICCCKGCASSCHEKKGHVVNWLAEGRGFCDCGAEGCDLLASSKVKAGEMLKFNSASSISLDEHGRIEGVTEIEIEDFRVDTVRFGDGNNVDNLILQELQRNAIELSHLSKDTFWVGSRETPRCLLEHYAKLVFLHHTSNSSTSTTATTATKTNTSMIESDDGSGAEWWVQVKEMDCSSSRESKGTNEGIGT